MPEKVGYMLGFADVLTVLSAISFFIGNILLSKSVEFHADKISLDDGSELSKNIKEMGSPGRIEPVKFMWGRYLNAAGFVLLLISTVFK
jgi:hypothetical protein